MMSYMDLQHQFAAVAHRGDTAATGFSPLEWNVVALARRDSLASLSEPGPLSRALGGLFGLGAKSKLADPRLEALRRMAVQAWHRGFQVAVSEIHAFKRAGFTVEQLETLLASIGVARNRRGPRLAEA